MYKRFFILLVFAWVLFFPTLSFNNLTTDIYDPNIKYYHLFDENLRNQILESADYELYIKTFLSSAK